MVVAELVFVKPCSLVERLGGEAEKEGVREVAGLFNRYAERRVDVTRTAGAGHINIFGNIAVAVVAREVRAVGTDDREQPSHAARTLNSAGHVRSPDVTGDISGLRDAVDVYGRGDVPAVPDEMARHRFCRFADTAIEVVVGV